LDTIWNKRGEGKKGEGREEKKQKGRKGERRREKEHGAKGNLELETLNLKPET
jgi:hypothetical protein